MMLRHIVSVTLAMTACVALMPTKASAATLTVIPVAEIQKQPGEVVEFLFAFTPNVSLFTTKFLAFTYQYDGSELSLALNGVTMLPMNTIVNNTTTVGSVRFNVMPGVVKDGSSDLFNAKVFYEHNGPGETPFASGADVVPVPEPLTMLGAAAALGYGAILKRKYSKNTEF